MVHYLALNDGSFSALSETTPDRDALLKVALTLVPLFESVELVDCTDGVHIHHLVALNGTLLPLGE